MFQFMLICWTSISGFSFVFLFFSYPKILNTIWIHVHNFRSAKNIQFDPNESYQNALSYFNGLCYAKFTQLCDTCTDFYQRRKWNQMYHIFVIKAIAIKWCSFDFAADCHSYWFICVIFIRCFRQRITIIGMLYCNTLRKHCICVILV